MKIRGLGLCYEYYIPISECTALVSRVCMYNEQMLETFYVDLLSLVPYIWVPNEKFDVISDTPRASLRHSLRGPSDWFYAHFLPLHHYIYIYLIHQSHWMMTPYACCTISFSISFLSIITQPSTAMVHILRTHNNYCITQRKKDSIFTVAHFHWLCKYLLNIFFNVQTWL